ncbi:MAG TPA: protein kinase [Pyrinomonadaceae bacterium]|jgi:serine/threonine protein kinase
MKPLAPNTLLQNRYLIVHLIGKGGMGEVYLAVDQRLGSAVALKRTLHRDDSQLGDAFEREARTLARLRHPALPKVSDHFIEHDNQFLVMEHISGDDLAKRLTATQKPFPLSWVLFWADQLLDALAYLHSHEPPIIHRDIKPQNLKLTDDNNIVLLDFGLSKNSTGQTLASGSGGSTGSVVGYTPHYAPMEQIRGTGTNPRSDIYSLSATLYQLLTNVVPPDALSRADFLLSGKADPIAPINEVNHEIPQSISNVVLKGMSISQDQRFTDAREMQRVLRETYAQMQSQMAEKTVAFVATEEPATAAPATQTSSFANDKTEQFSAPVFDQQTASKEAMGAQTIPFGMVGGAGAEALSKTDKSEPVPNFDATLKIGEVPEDVAALPTKLGEKTEVMPIAEVSPKQSGIQTEIMGSDFGAAEYLQNDHGATPKSSESVGYGAQPDDKYPASTPNFTGDKTIPLIGGKSQPADVDLMKTQAVSAFDATGPAENFAPVGHVSPPANESFAPAGNSGFPQTVPQQFDSQPKAKAAPAVQPKTAEKKKSKGLLFGVLGALFGLVILAAAGGGIAWYMMNQQSAPPIANTATPTPAPSLSPTPEPTPEQANTETGNTSNSASVANTDSDNSAVNAATPVPSPTRPVVTAPQTPVTQPTRTVNTPRPVTNTPRPATPRPETKPTLRGTRDIPQ